MKSRRVIAMALWAGHNREMDYVCLWIKKAQSLVVFLHTLIQQMNTGSHFKLIDNREKEGITKIKKGPS